MSAFAKRLKYIRTKKKISQHKLAEALGYNVGTISRWEKGIFEPPTEVIKKIADFFDVSTDYLMGITDNPEKPRDSDSLPKKKVIDLIDILEGEKIPHLDGEPLTPKQLADLNSLLRAFIEMVQREKGIN